MFVFGEASASAMNCPGEVGFSAAQIEAKAGRLDRFPKKNALPARLVSSTVPGASITNAGQLAFSSNERASNFIQTGSRATTYDRDAFSPGERPEPQ